MRREFERSNNTNKLSPQELFNGFDLVTGSSNNTNKLSPQELNGCFSCKHFGSNNTNKLSPQELAVLFALAIAVQIIQINLVLKNL